MSETTERSAYDKLSPQRKQLADMLVANLDSGGLWKQGWRDARRTPKTRSRERSTGA